MTAVLGILNKHAVAIAADSAVTIGEPNNHKIFNRANKVFALSKRHPIGILLFNSASFMTTPWETIIKIYRKQLGDNNFPTVRDYQQNFINYLHTKNLFSDAELQYLFLHDFTSKIIDSVNNEVIRKNRTLTENPTNENKEEFVRLFELHIDGLIDAWSNHRNLCPEFLNYTFEWFEGYSDQVFVDLIQKRYSSQN